MGNFFEGPMLASLTGLFCFMHCVSTYIAVIMGRRDITKDLEISSEFHGPPMIYIVVSFALCLVRCISRQTSMVSKHYKD